MRGNFNSIATRPVARHRRWTGRRLSRRQRQGNILVLIAILLPVLFGMIGLIYDSGALMYENRHMQQVSDAAATCAAKELQLTGSMSDARQIAIQCVQEQNGFSEASVTVNRPPLAGSFAGQPSCVEVIVSIPVSARFIHVLGVDAVHDVEVRSVAGFEDATDGAAIVALEERPAPINILSSPPIVASLSANLAGVEVLGLGEVSVQGAVLVNAEWEGVDGQGETVGVASEALLVGGLQHGVSCTPVIGLTSLACTDLRVVGGVDNVNNYTCDESGETRSLQAGRLPVADPFASLPVPTSSSDPTNVSSALRGGVRVVGIPLLSLPVTLEPGVYEWIEIVSGVVRFNPGVYIIRGTNPVTGIALNILGGSVTGNGVMFYITNNTGYSPSGTPTDASDGETAPPPLNVTSLLPSVLINTAVFPVNLSGLNSPGSPFDGMLLYQRRYDRRPMVLLNEKILLGGDIAGTIYSKWGHVTFIGAGTYDLRFVAGTVRLVTVIQLTIDPSELLPAAQDVFLVE